MPIETLGSRNFPMPVRLRKFIGGMALVIYIITYSLLVMKLASVALPSIGGWGQLGFYVLFGVIWVVPAGAIVYWMQKPRTS